MTFYTLLRHLGDPSGSTRAFIVFETSIFFFQHIIVLTLLSILLYCIISGGDIVTLVIVATVERIKTDSRETL